MGRLNRNQAEVVRKVLSEPAPIVTAGRYEHGVVSTGSLLLDLAISGTRIKGGGIPGGIIVEMSGPPSSGKTSLLAEILGSVQRQGGDTCIKDPEARLDQEYASIYGVNIDKRNYSKPDTVSEVFESLRHWGPQPGRDGAICAQGIDSLAALSTRMELDEKDGDKRGQRRAKEFSEGLRKACRIIEKNNWLIACTNQEREGERGPITPGGKGIPYYASLRIRLAPKFPSSKIEREIRYSPRSPDGRKADGARIKTQIGVITECFISKSSIDRPFRRADIYVVFNYGIHDIMANLQYYKDNSGLSRYVAANKSFQSIEDAIQHIEENNLESELRNMVMEIWYDIQEQSSINRKPKMRF